MGVERLKDHCSAQYQNIIANGDLIAAGTMSFFTNLQDDFTAARIELSEILKFIIKSLGSDVNYFSLC